MSEADTIREALEGHHAYHWRAVGPQPHDDDACEVDDALLALTALERRAEQEVIRAEHAEAGLSLLNADRERAERRAEQAERARDEAVELPDRDALRARAEQAEAALREIAESHTSGGFGSAGADIRGQHCLDLVRIASAALAATTPGEPPTCPTCGSADWAFNGSVEWCEDSFHTPPATTPGEPE